MFSRPWIEISCDDEVLQVFTAGGKQAEVLLEVPLPILTRRFPFDRVHQNDSGVKARIWGVAIFFRADHSARPS